ncbi:hypothetical protein [Rhodococcus sp. UNC363MFTsu5.1]|uniref:hypothetical protein n=1 Tax=Rhodococcus sp. UNC363MFTsu5.1 TaxID=1449069 RepID=UPI0004863559|nr:hypothetical protein [Rhodococcus sp. UNC363MFTsu5.1]
MSAPAISLAGFAAALDEQAASLGEAGVDGSEDYMFRSESLALAKLSAETALALADRQAQIDEQEAPPAADGTLGQVRDYANALSECGDQFGRHAGRVILDILGGGQ